MPFFRRQLNYRFYEMLLIPDSIRSAPKSNWRTFCFLITGIYEKYQILVFPLAISVVWQESNFNYCSNNNRNDNGHFARNARHYALDFPHSQEFFSFFW